MAVIKSEQGFIGQAIKRQNDSTKKVIGGQNCNVFGSDNTGLILKGTSVKVQWGNRFIDIFKDGKLAVDSPNILNEVSSEEQIVEDGIYLLSDTKELWFKIGNQKISISGGAYLSFLTEQNLTSDQKYRTLTNAGFYYKTLQEAKEANIVGGIIYVEDERKLYILIDGVLQDYSLILENKAQSELLIGDLRIYKSSSMILESPSLIISINGEAYISLKDDIQVSKNIVTSAEIKSSDFRLYSLNGLSLLEIDQIINRSEFEDNAIIYGSHNNLITSYSTSGDTVNCTLLSTNRFVTGDTIYALVKYTNVISITNNGTIITAQAQQIVSNDVVIEITVNGEVQQLSIAAGSQSASLDYGQEIISLEYTIVSGPSNVSLTGSNKANIFKYEILESNETSIKFRGNLDYNNCRVYRQPLIIVQNGVLEVVSNNKSVVKISNSIDAESINIKKDNQVVVKLDSNGAWSNNYTGTSSDMTFTNYPKYSNTLQYPINTEDYTKSIPSVEWVEYLIKSYLPIGTIIMCNGSSIPDGWHICDGTNGTPDLIGKFIKASNTAGTIGGSDSISLLENNIPNHGHTIVSSGTVNETTSKSTTLELINIPKDDRGNITDYQIKSWGTTEYEVVQSCSTEEKELEIDTALNDEEIEVTPINIEPSYYSLVFIMKCK